MTRAKSFFFFLSVSPAADKRKLPVEGFIEETGVKKNMVWRTGRHTPPRIPKSTPPGALPRSLAEQLREGLKPTKTSINGKMASTFRQGSEKAENALANHWGQLIFTHDSKPPVLISKEVVRLGRKEGEKDQRLCTDLSLYTCKLAHNFYVNALKKLSLIICYVFDRL